MTAKKYESPGDFKQALEARLRNASATGLHLARRRQLLVFDRFLARVVQVMGDTVILKGGLVLELRLARARTTRDIDLRFDGDEALLLPMLRQAGRLDLGDFLAFEVREAARQAQIRDDVGQQMALRFRAEARLAGKLYGEPFGVDVGFGEPITGEPDIVRGEDVLSFAGITPPTLRLYPVESHIAEKLHAYTLPRDRPNSRVKDLPDLALLGKTRPIQARALRESIEETFAFRRAQPVPAVVPDPPAEWAPVYERIARQDGLEWPTLTAVVNAVRTFLGPVLSGEDVGQWLPGEWRWEDPGRDVG